jgi:hypothetical protein
MVIDPYFRRCWGLVLAVLMSWFAFANSTIKMPFLADKPTIVSKPTWIEDIVG